MAEITQGVSSSSLMHCSFSFHPSYPPEAPPFSKDEHNASSGLGRLWKDKRDQQTRRAQGRGEEEAMRKPRGRPPGSKNRPKPPIIITRDKSSGMTPHVLEIPTGYDVGESVAAFARKGQRGLFILTGSGSVSNVALRQPSAVGSTVTFHGCFEILAMSGAFIFQPTAFASAGLTISLAGAQGQVLGGNVVGALVAASPVLVIAASFLGPSYDRLPDVEADDEAKLLAAATTISVSPPDPSSTGLYSIAPSPFGGYQLPPDILAWAAGPRTQL